MTTPLTYTDEARFEDDVVAMLRRHGWDEVLHRPTERQLIDNWAEILYNNNRDQDRLGDVPLTSTEMDQIIEQITELRTPLRLNEFINGRSVAITRDAPAAHNLGKEVSLKIYDRREIAGGQSYYQIARQPKFATAAHKLLPERRGDLMLLINGMPVIHLELKRSGVPVSQATNQIIKYAHEGVYTGLFSLVQIFAAMTPTETLYFANPGPCRKFNPDFFFHWADFNNEPINDWPTVVTSLLSIPMAHQLIGFYTVTDRATGILMAMRSYQYFAAHRIADRVEGHEWGSDNKGGYIWHTTGSGKTITSFKTAQLIADSKNADKTEPTSPEPPGSQGQEPGGQEPGGSGGQEPGGSGGQEPGGSSDGGGKAPEIDNGINLAVRSKQVTAGSYAVPSEAQNSEYMFIEVSLKNNSSSDYQVPYPLITADLDGKNLDRVTDIDNQKKGAGDWPSSIAPGEEAIYQTGFLVTGADAKRAKVTVRLGGKKYDFKNS